MKKLMPTLFQIAMILCFMTVIPTAISADVIHHSDPSLKDTNSNSEEITQSFSAHVKKQQQKIRPNIIILLADDLGYGDLSSYGHPSIETPALDRLAAEGQRWTDFYATAPVCSPTRGALMTGKLPVRSGLYGVEHIVFLPGAKGQIPTESPTIAQMLKSAGYNTAMMGKWHLGDKADALPTRYGFDHWFGTPYSNDLPWAAEPYYEELHKKAKKDRTPEENKKYSELTKKRMSALSDPNGKSSDWDVPLIDSYKLPSGYADKIVERPSKQETLTKRYTEGAVSFIKKQAKSDKPFFLYVSYNMPHVPTFASKNFKGKSIGGRYGDSIEEIDWSVQEIRHALEKAGIAENTLLIFSSDNGAAGYVDTASSGLLKGYKAQTFEGGMRVPGIFWWPGHIKPEIVHGIGSLTDIYATAQSLAGITNVADDTDSIDLSPVFLGTASPRKSLLYYSITGQLNGYRKGAWKVSFTDNGYQPSDKVKLYNLEHDPSEKTDLSKAHPEKLKELVNEAKQRDAAIPQAEPIFDQ